MDKYIEAADKITGIIDSLGPVNSDSVGEEDVKNTLTKEQRIQFAYSLYTANDVNENIIGVYEYIVNKEGTDLYSENNKYHKFYDFCNVQLGLADSDNYIDSMSRGLAPNIEDPSYQRAIHGREWLSTFDKEHFFKDNDGQEIVHKYQTENGDITELKEEELDTIINYLDINGVPCKNCIVKEAIKKYINGELEDFVTKLTSGNYLNSSEKEENKSNTI